MDTKIRLTSYQLESSVRTKQYTLTERILEQYKALLDEQYEINLSFQLAPDREKVCIAVTDTGPVFPLKNKLRYSIALRSWMITNPVRVLGLSICLLIAEWLNGSLSIDSSIYNPQIEE